MNMKNHGRDDLYVGPASEVEVLEREECLRLLREAPVGCLALASESAPELLPVNFVVWDGSIVIRTGEGKILDAGRRGQTVSFQIHGTDRLEHTGFSVNVVGKLTRLATDRKTLSLPLRPWASGVKDCFVTLSLTQVTGRRIPPGRGNR